MPFREAHRQSPAWQGERVCGPQRRVNARLRLRKLQTPDRRAGAITVKAVGGSGKATCGITVRRSRERWHAHKAMGWKQGRAPRPVEKDHGSKVTVRAEEAKPGEGESLTDGPVVAEKRGNACGAKGPYRRHSSNKARQERDDKAHH